MKYLIYLRVSTEEQDVETQKQMCMDKIQNIHPDGRYKVKLFTDHAVSSGVQMDKRTELQNMLHEVKKGDTVIVYKLDRLSRDVIEMVTIHRLIVKTLGAHVISLNDPYSDEFSVGLMGLIAQKERDTIKLRTKDKLANKKFKGERYSRFLPYGFAMHETKTVGIKVNGEIIQKRGILIPLHHEQQAIVLMLQMHENGYSYQEICKSLTLLGYKNREEKPFQKMTVYRILERSKKATLPDQLQEAKELQSFH